MNMIYKMFLSVAVIISFSFYAYVLRTENNQIVAVAPSVVSTDTTQQTTAGNSTPPSSTDLQTYINQINTAATQTQTAPAQRVVTQVQPAASTQQTASQAQLAQQQEAEQAAQQEAAQQQAAANAQAVAQAQASAQSGQYKNGTYTGPSVNVYYGYVQVQAVITNGKLADVQFLSYPSDRSTSVRINRVAMPILSQEAIQAQSASVDGVSGATDTSQGFIQSLGNALSQAKA
jgi:uncharacterized protein with FMN-binding domain